MTSLRASPTRPKVFSIAELRAETGLSRRTIWELVAAKQFPAPIHLSVRRVGWVATEIDDWLAQRIKERDEGEPRPPPVRRVGRPPE